MWNWIKNLLGPKPDPRPDPEDLAAYAHVEKVLVEFEQEGGHFQVLRGGKKPSDVEKVTKLSSPAGFEYWIDVYDGPLGKGYVINYECVRGGKLIQKAVNFGPEEWREQDWKEIANVPGR